MPTVGDRVRVESTKIGQAPRDGVVTGVIGSLLRIQWSTGEESTVVPGPGAVAVVGKGEGIIGQAGHDGRQGHEEGEESHQVGRKQIAKHPVFAE